ncbi:GNAT family N-acetyltransferase [Marinilactibacillus sp. XAAS-LB27]|uniref:GNAT family N-acetyltransferase n=1 Tax=Marinilactibacillus sp. XAAS-LB27 TaxID=3114538 RepID=UPI002E190185|nr:GNAT family N-acetyltransferase [Marinilactibacillus sp. XAAS-LB27]
MSTKAYTIRTHQLGDMGWITYRHAMTVALDYGWGQPFESMIGEITANFLKTYDPAKERCFIAERDGKMLGCVFVVNAGQQTAKLRVLFVEPEARGLGLAKRLVDEVVQFSREAGYETILLWTMQMLGSARHVYQKAGFKIIGEEINTEFGENLISETWELCLRDAESI